MPSFSKAHYGSGKKTIQIKLQTPSGEVYEASVLVDEKIGDLAKDFYEFAGMEEDINRVKAYLADPVTRIPIAPLSMDRSIENQDQKIIENAVILFVTDDGGFSIELTPEKTLQVLMPFPKNLAVSEFLNYSNNFLTASDFIYSVFSILLSENNQSVDALQRMLVESPKRLVEPKIIHQILRISTNAPLELAKVHYGSPIIFDLVGLLKPLELLRDLVKDIDEKNKNDRWKRDYDEQAAELDLQSRHLDIVKKRLDIALTISNMQISDHSKSQLLVSCLPGVTNMNSVLKASNTESELQHHQPFSEQRYRNFPNGNDQRFREK